MQLLLAESLAVAGKSKMAYHLVLPYSMVARLKCEEGEAAYPLKLTELKSFRTTLLSHSVSQSNS